MVHIISGMALFDPYSIRFVGIEPIKKNIDLWFGGFVEMSFQFVTVVGEISWCLSSLLFVAYLSIVLCLSFVSYLSCAYPNLLRCL